MALRTRHGKSAQLGGVGPVVEVPPVHELRNARVAAPVAAPTSPVGRSPGGQIKDREAARELGRRGAAVRAEKRERAQQFATRLRLGADMQIFEVSKHAQPFSEEAEAFYGALIAQLQRESDGVVSPAVSAIARSASWQTYCSRMLFELATSKVFMVEQGANDRPIVNTTYVQQASRLAEAARQSLLACHHLQALEAEARARTPRSHDDFARALAEAGKPRSE